MAAMSLRMSLGKGVGKGAGTGAGTRLGLRMEMARRWATGPASGGAAPERSGEAATAGAGKAATVRPVARNDLVDDRLEGIIARLQRLTAEVKSATVGPMPDLTDAMTRPTRIVGTARGPRAWTTTP